MDKAKSSISGCMVGMVSKRKSIMEYMVWKDKSIHEKIEIHLYEDYDFDRVKDMDDTDINKIYEGLKEVADYEYSGEKINLYKEIDDSSICPDCILHFGYPSRCIGCQYRANHGMCIDSNEESTYGMIINNIGEGNGISELIGKDLIKEKLKELFV